MRHTWNEDQLLLRSMLERYVAEAHSFEKRRARIEGGFSRETWTSLAELGLLGLPFDEADGGAGGTPLDLYLVMEALGEGAVVEPFLPSVILAGGLIRRCATAEQRARLLPPLIGGESLLAFGFAEDRARFNLAHVETRAMESGDCYILNGKKSVVYGAPESSALFVTARLAGDRTARDGVSVFLVAADAPGMEIQAYHCIDGMLAADIVLNDVRVDRGNLFGAAGQAIPIVERVINEATAAVCAEAVGVMGALNRRCLEWSKTRIAFGKALAEFQVIQHRLVDMHIACEVGAAAAIKAAHALAFDGGDCSRVVSACKAQVNEEAAFIGKAAVQLHGAIGMTDELDIGHYFKRLMAIQAMFGSTDHHVGRFISASAA